MAKKQQKIREEAVPEIGELKSSLDFTKTRVDHIGLFLIELLGSLSFLFCCVLFFSVWITWNTSFFGLRPFDPFPFPILTMLVSLFAIILSVSVLINQNRQGKMDKIRQQVEFEVNVRAENEITKVLNMLHDIHQHLGLNSLEDKELEEMKAPIDISQIHKALDEKQENEPGLLEIKNRAENQD